MLGLSGICCCRCLSSLAVKCLECKSWVPGGCVGLVNCTTIDWFTEWPADALYEVAAKQLADEDLGSQQIKSDMCQVGLGTSTNLYLHS